MSQISSLKSQISPSKILIRLPNWLGDVVMSTSFIAAVKHFYPGALVDVVIKKELKGIAGLIPGLNNIHSFSKTEHPGLRGVYRFGKSLRSENYDLFFCLPDSLSSAVMAYATKAKQRIGFSKEGRFFLMTKSYLRPKNVHRVEEYVNLLEQFTGKSVQIKEVKLVVNPKQPKSAGLVIINFNSEAISRRMPVDKATAILHLLDAGFTDVQFALIGSPKEKDFIDSLIVDFNRDRFSNYAGQTSLAQLAELIASAKAILTTDSGPAHLANSVGTPTVVLFGAGNELNTAPYNKAYLTVLRSGQLLCEPCLNNTCKLYGIPKCLQLVDDFQIITALSLYLADA